MDANDSREAIAQHLETLRKRLIDISNRNKLVSFRPTKKACIELALPDVSSLHTSLVEGDDTLRLLAGVEYIVEGVRTKRKKSGVAAEPLHPSRQDVEKAQSQGRVLCLHDEGDLEARADYIRREAKAVLDETGINHLYLALGFLRWRESDDSEEDRRSPLLLVPVILSREAELGRGGNRSFSIEHDGGELFPNLSLIERLRTDFGLDLPRFGEESNDVEEFLADVARTVRGRKGWEVEFTAFLSFFSFAKLRMYVDLDPAKWPEGCGLLENSLVGQILEGSLLEPEGTGFGAIEVTDDHPTAHEIPLVVEADSSQHTAILKTWEGKNLVIEGPPGTGKSQTITNIIAAALNQGKTVLFVSEKLAALEVVKRNLDVVGLGEFCLELHSHKTRKQEVHASFSRRIRWSPPTSNRFEATRREWLGQIDQLKQYLDACGRVLGPREEEVFRIMGRAIHLRETSIPAIRDPLCRLDLDADKFTRALACLQEIGRHLRNPEDFRDHPWKGFLCERTRAGDEMAIEREFQALALTLEEAVAQTGEFEQRAGAGSCPPPSLVEGLTARGDWKLPSPPPDIATDILHVLASVENSNSLAATIAKANSRLNRLGEARKTLSSGAIDRGGLGEWLLSSSETAIAQRLGDFPIVTMHEKLPAMLEVAVLVTEAVQLADRITSMELGSAATVDDLARFLTRLHTCGSAPLGIKDILTSEHRFPNAENVRTAAEKEAFALQARQQQLEPTFVISDSPPSTSVHELKKRLRSTGGRWFSVFNRDYRQARNATCEFIRNRKHFAFPKILEVLDDLEEWRKDTENFAVRQELTTVLGPAFKGLATNWPLLGAVIQWSLAMTREALPWPLIEKMATPDQQVKVREITAHLEAVLRRLKTATSEASILLDALFDGRSYQALEMRELQRATSEWSEWLRQTLETVFPVTLEKTTTFAQIKAAACHIVEAESLSNSITTDDDLNVSLVRIHAAWRAIGEFLRLRAIGLRSSVH